MTPARSTPYRSGVPPFHVLVAVMLAAMAFTPVEATTLVQSASATCGTPTCSATFAAPPTLGNLLVACFGSRGMVSTLPGGWTAAVTVDNGTEADRLQLAYKIAGLNEPSAVPFTNLTPEGHALSIAEFTGIGAAPLDVTASTGRSPGVTSISSGMTATTAQPDALSLVCGHARANIGSPAWDGGVTPLHNLIAISPNTVEILSGYKVETTQGAKSYTMTWTTSATALAAIAVFKSSGVPNPPPDPTVVGRWAPVEALPFFPVHTHLLPTGKVLVYPGDMGISGDNPHSWDPATGAISPLATAGWDLFCAGHAFLGDGRLLVVGGHIQNNVGLPNAGTYNPFTNTWVRHGNMNAGRWYPTATTLANGDALVVSGSIDSTTGVNRLPQVFQTLSGTFRDLTSAQLGLALFPTMFLAPNGQVFNSGPSQATRYLDTAGSGAWSAVGDRTFGVRDYGSAVMYDGRVLMMGGGDPPTPTAEIIDLNGPSPAWRAVPSMASARRQLNATILADGSVLVSGGSSGPGFSDANAPVYSAEIWDPATETWMTVANASIPRLYHSAALLLPDGRVYSTGGNGYPQAEVYEPPYLFKGARPSITSAPQSVAYGETFVVGTPNPAAIARVHWIRLSSVTHAFNQNQRLNTLAFTAGAGGLNVTAPAGGALAPPGHYMLFLVNGSGVPSVAAIIQIGAAAAAPTVTSTSPASGATGVGTGTSVTATFSQAMDATTISTSTFLLRDPASTLVTATVTYNAASRTATLTPTAPLAAGTTYTATVRGGATDPRVKDTAGTALAADYVWSFTTATPPPPTVTSTSPASGATGVGTGTNVTATFSQAMDATTISTSTFLLRNPASTLVIATVTYDAASLTATLTPTAPLAAGTTYTATVRGGATDPRVKDTAGTALAADYVWSFTTATPPPPPPTVTFTSPASGATGVGTAASVTATFSQAMDATTISTSTFLLRDPASTLVTATVTYSAASLTATLTPAAPLAAGTTYTATVRGGATDPRVKDTAGTALAADYVWSFTTATLPPPPTVTSTSPASGATGVGTGTNVTATFSQAMDATTVSTSTFLLRDPASTLVTATVTYNAASRTATLTPTAPLAAGTTYTATVRGGATDPRVKDTAGTALAADYVWSFTTATPPPATFTLTVSKGGSGQGTVTSSPSGINCGGTCSAAFPAQTVVTLTATPATGSTFQGWTGVRCGNTTTCVVTMTGNLSLGAKFQRGK